MNIISKSWMFFSKIDGLSVLLNYRPVLLEYLRATVYFWLFLRQSKIQSEYYNLQTESLLRCSLKNLSWGLLQNLHWNINDKVFFQKIYSPGSCKYTDSITVFCELTLFWCLHCYLWTYFTYCSGVDFEKWMSAVEEVLIGRSFPLKWSFQWSLLSPLC